MNSATNIDSIIAENKRRLAELNAVYNPLTGEGSISCKRRELALETGSLFLPVQMFNAEHKADRKLMELLLEYRSFQKVADALCKGHGMVTENDVRMHFIKFRIKYDFEYWAAKFVKIKPKAGTKAAIESRGDDVPFILNHGQRVYLKHLLEPWFAKEPIRIILLKARQWGGSTLTQIFFMWVQFVHLKKWNSVICAHVKDAATKIEGMYNNAIEVYPNFLDDSANGKKIYLKPYMGSETTRQVSTRGCTISIGTAEKPNALRSTDVSLAHFSEVAFFKKTKNGSTAEDFVRNVSSGVATVHGTVVVFESTADGVGDFFHSEWLAAVKANHKKDLLHPSYDPVFIAWYDIENYAVDIENYREFVMSMSDYEFQLFSLGACLEQINWYRWKAADIKDANRLHSEFPSNPTEAFLSTGRPYFPIEHCKKLELNCYEPAYVGEVMSDALYGVEALNNCRFVKNEQAGKFKAWSLPDNSVRMYNRYVVVADVNRGISSGADNGIICVFDRYWMVEGGKPEVVAEWCGKEIMAYFAWTAARIAQFYNNAYLVIESNTPDSAPGNGGYMLDTILDEIGMFYENMYYRLGSSQDFQGNRPKKYGYHTNSQTKPRFCAHHQVVLANDLYIERCFEAVVEHETFEYKDDGTLGAAAKSHDDRLITRALGCYIIYKEMDAPVLMDDSKFRLHRTHTGTESQFL